MGSQWFQARTLPDTWFWVPPELLKLIVLVPGEAIQVQTVGINHPVVIAAAWTHELTQKTRGNQ